MRSVAAALADARALGLDLLDAQILLANCLGSPRAWLLAHGDAEVQAAQQIAFTGFAERRARGEPLAYLVREKEFHGLVLHVDARVLVPRPETEHLVDWALDLLSQWSGQGAPRVLDLGTGSGAIALATKAARPGAQVSALDASPDALAVARANAERLGLRIEWLLGNWWSAVPSRAFDLAMCNPPYIAAGDPHLQALGHEPRVALTPGGAGLEALLEVIEAAPLHLESGAWLLLEHGASQGDAVRQALSGRGFVEVGSRRDLAGLDRCSGGRRP